MRSEGDNVNPWDPGWEKSRRGGGDPDLEDDSDSVSDKEVTMIPSSSQPHSLQVFPRHEQEMTYDLSRARMM